LPGSYPLWFAVCRFGIDITKKPMLIYPALHYQNGGIKFSPDGSTPVPGLFAAGEVEGECMVRIDWRQLIIDLFVFGRRALEPPPNMLRR